MSVDDSMTDTTLTARRCLYYLEQYPVPEDAYRRTTVRSVELLQCQRAFAHARSILRLASPGEFSPAVIFETIDSLAVVDEIDPTALPDYLLPSLWAYTYWRDAVRESAAQEALQMCGLYILKIAARCDALP